LTYALGDGVTGGSVDGEPYDVRVGLEGRIHTWSLYGTDTLSLRDRWHVTLSSRYDAITVHNTDRIHPGGAPGSLDGDHAFRRFNPALGVTFRASEALGAYVAYGEGSRAPTSIELGCADPNQPCKLPNAMAGDPPLRQVVTRTWEAGVRGRRGAFEWSAGVFRATNRDDILFVLSEETSFGYFKNFGKTRRRGLELGGSAGLGRLRAGGGYTYLRASFESPEPLNGESNSSNYAAAAGFPGLEGGIAVVPGNRMPLIPAHLFKA
jgi:outer membrane receptor protein involved in Fe transport